ncbi:TerC family protein [Blattabacterium cuenoti]|uniref:TerC family protein n=1 Tax=Blattabacterium cuenoti TaxID=1653831 RepID=UPI00311D72FC
MNIEKSIAEIIHHPISSLFIIGNLFLIESILSIDNAAILASIILNLKKKDRKKAIKYGIIGAYFFRGLCLLFASILIKIWWLKPLGGIYLIFVGLKHFFMKKKFFHLKNEKKQDSFWKIIFIIEIMDLAFSIDNIFASVALSENLILIFLGVCIGIFSMRLIAQFFVQLMDKIPELKHSSFLVIIILGIKLIFFSKKYVPDLFLFFFSEKIFSLLTFSIFIFPIFLSMIKKIINKLK